MVNKLLVRYARRYVRLQRKKRLRRERIRSFSYSTTTSLNSENASSSDK